MCIAIGVPEGVTLLEFEGVNPDDPTAQEPKGQPLEVRGEGGHNIEDLPECLDHQPSSFLKGKPQSIISLPCFTKS
jgi:hypothetical protein